MCESESRAVGEDLVDIAQTSEHFRAERNEKLSVVRSNWQLYARIEAIPQSKGEAGAPTILGQEVDALFQPEVMRQFWEIDVRPSDEQSLPRSDLEFIGDISVDPVE